MKFHESESKLQSLLLDTLILLCKNGLQFHKDLKIQGTLGVTVDEDEIVFVHIDKKLEAGLEQAEPKKSNKRTSQSKAVIPKPGKNMRKTNNGDTRTNARVSATQERAEVGEFCDDKIFFQGAELKFEKVVDEDLDMEAGNGSDANEYVQTLEIKQEVTDDECWDISAVEAVPRLDQASVEGVVGYIAAVHGDVSQELEGDDSMQEQAQLKKIKLRATGEKQLFIGCTPVTTPDLDDSNPRTQCPFCSKLFKHTHHLRDHIRVHTGETPYYCRVCAKGFKQSQGMRRHEREIHGLENRRDPGQTPAPRKRMKPSQDQQTKEGENLETHDIDIQGSHESGQNIEHNAPKTEPIQVSPWISSEDSLNMLQVNKDNEPGRNPVQSETTEDHQQKLSKVQIIDS